MSRFALRRRILDWSRAVREAKHKTDVSLARIARVRGVGDAHGSRLQPQTPFLQVVAATPWGVATRGDVSRLARGTLGIPQSDLTALVLHWSRAGTLLGMPPRLGKDRLFPVFWLKKLRVLFGVPVSATS